MDSEVKLENFEQFIELVGEQPTRKLALFRGQRTDEPLLPKLARLRLRGELKLSEKKMYDDFQRRSLPFLEQPPSTKWDWLALMQHHGLATRLLDWSANPLAALWFATAKPPKKDKEGNLRSAVVWVFKPTDADMVDIEKSTNPFEGKRTQVFQPSHITRRIIAQFGWFTAHKALDEDRFVPLESNRMYKNKLSKITIPPSLFAELRMKLKRFGVSSAVLFPDLVGLCESIQWEHSLLDDETKGRPRVLLFREQRLTNGSSRRKKTRG